MTTIRARIGLSMAILLAVMACSSRQTSSTSGLNRNLITTAELQKAGYTDGFMAVQSLRPHWLQVRGRSMRGGETIKVYLDGSLLGGVDQLRQITTRSISSMRYYNGLEASERWGLDHGQGAIVVSTRGT